MKTIGLLYDSYLNFGGVEQHLLGLLRRADAARWQFIIISNTSEAFAAQVAALGARVVKVTRWRITDPGAVAALAGVLREHGVDLVHAHSPTAAAVGRLAARRLRLPAVVTVHLPVAQYHGVRTTLRARLGRWIYTTLDRYLNHSHPAPLLYVSQAVRDACVAAGHSPTARSLVIPNGIELELYAGEGDPRNLRAQAGVLEGEKVIICCGRLHPQKGVDVLLQALAQPGMPQHALRLWLVGDGSQRDELEQQALRLGLGERVRFWGYQAQVADYLRAADVFALPSRWEAMPFALLEALAAGLPCVVTAVGDNALLARDSLEGLVIPPEDPAALADALRRLVTDDALRARMALSARQRAGAFSQDEMARRIEEIYDSSLSQAI